MIILSKDMIDHRSYAHNLKGQSHELRMRDYLPLGSLTQQLAAITDMDSSVSLNVKLGLY